MDSNHPAPEQRSPVAGAASVLMALVGARKALRLYPRTNPQVGLTFRRLQDTLGKAAMAHAPVVLEVERDYFSAAGQPLSTPTGDLGKLAFKLHCLNVDQLILHAGLDQGELVALVSVLNQPYETLRSLGPLSQTLQARDIYHATVTFVGNIAPTVDDGTATEEATTKPAADGGDDPRERPPSKKTKTRIPPVVPLTDPLLRRPQHLIDLLDDPGQFARELVRHCVEVVPGPAQTRLDAQLAFVDRCLKATGNAIEAAPAKERPELYGQLVAVIEALMRSADVSGARFGDLPQVDLTHVDPKVFDVLPQRDLVREISSKVKLHQGATTVMTSALRDLKLTQSGQHPRPNVIIEMIGDRPIAAGSVSSNIQVLEDIVSDGDIDGEYPGIKFAERDRNKNFSLGVDRLSATLDEVEKREAIEVVAALDEWRPEVDSIETILDMLANEKSIAFLQMIAERLAEKLATFLRDGDLEPALHILRGLIAERRTRTTDRRMLAILDQTMLEVQGVDNISILLQHAEALPIESPAFETIQSFLLLMDVSVVHSIIDVVARDRSRYSQRRILALAQFLCRDRLELLAEGLLSPEPEIARTVTWLLGHFGSPALRHLMVSVQHPDPRVRREAVRALARDGEQEADELLLTLVRDADYGVMGSALHAIQSRSTAGADPYIEAALLDDEWGKRPRELNLLLLRTAARLGGKRSLVALKRAAEHHGGSRFKLTASPLRDAFKSAQRELELRLARTETIDG